MELVVSTLEKEFDFASHNRCVVPQIVEVTGELGFSGPIEKLPDGERAYWFLPEGWDLWHCGFRTGVELVWTTGFHANRALSRWIRILAKRAPQRRFFHIHGLSPDPLQCGLVDPETRRLSVRAFTGPLTVEVQHEIAEIDVAARDHLVFRLLELVQREEVTKRFFRDFRTHLHRLEGAWTGTSVALDKHQRRDLTVLLLCRLMFVAFLSRDRPLAGRRNYLRWLLEQPREGDIFGTALKPLFFDALNKPLSERSLRARRLGDLPFLNGGLFNPSALEEAEPGLTLPDELLAEAIYALFECYEFSTEEDDGSALIDPEMLGKVFEALMHSDERRTSGSFYTPTTLVRGFVSEALVESARELGGPTGHWVAQCLNGGGRSELPSQDRTRLRDYLSSIRILDPAVGSGAFLLGTLDALVLLRSALEPDASIDRLKRSIVSTNLFGVDLKAGAVTLCELRLWLSVLASSPKEMPIKPLPNLDHHIRQGDSLLEPHAALSRPSSVFRPPSDQHFGDLHGAEKRKAEADRKAFELARIAQLVESRLNQVEADRQTIERFAGSQDLFGVGNRLNTSQAKRRRELESERLRLEESLRAVGRGELPFFSFRSAFPEVFENRGFNIVIGNPPWVRLHDIDSRSRAELRARFRSCRGGGTGFSNQVDLAVPFVERSLELLRPNGVLALLVPSKVVQAQYGGVIRQILRQETDVISFTDLHGHPKLGFGASNYPSWIVSRRRLPQFTSQIRVTSYGQMGRAESDLRSRSTLSVAVDPASPWCSAPKANVIRFREMAQNNIKLSEYGVRARLGLKTGANRLFLCANWKDRGSDLIELSMADGSVITVPSERAPIVLRGRDIGASKLPATGPCHRVLLPYDRVSLQPARELPDDLRTYFEEHRDSLLARSDSGAGPLWQVFRTHCLAPAHRVVWRDIATRLEAAFIPPGASPLPLNTCYYFDVADEYEGHLLSGLLNSAPIRDYAAAIAEPAMGGHHRFMAWVIESLPYPHKLRPGSRRADQLVALSRRGHEEGADIVQDDVDRLVRSLFRSNWPTGDASELRSAD